MLPVFEPNSCVPLTDTSGNPSESAARASYWFLPTPASPDLCRSETDCKTVRASS